VTAGLDWEQRQELDRWLAEGDAQERATATRDQVAEYRARLEAERAAQAEAGAPQ
jgi:hypothetical protein